MALKTPSAMCGLLLSLALLVLQPSAAAQGARARKLWSATGTGAPAAGTKGTPIPNCYLVETVGPSPSHVTRASRRRLLSEASAQHTDALVAKAKAAIGEEAVTSHQPLGPVFPGFSIRTRHAGDAARLADFLDGAEEVVAYRECRTVSAMKPDSLGPVVGPPPVDVIVNGIYQSSDGAEVRSMPGFKNLYGQGITVAVIDSGIDYKHPGLGGCLGPGCKVAGGYDFIGTFPGGPSPNPIGCAAFDHGTMVAGIIAGNYSMTYTKPSGGTATVTYLGVAPGVRLLAFRVFSCNGQGATDDIVAAALQKAYEAGADIINLSLGSSGVWETGSGSLEERLTKLGVFVVQAQGNDADQGLFMGSEVTTSSRTAPTLPQISVGSTDDNRITGAASITFSTNRSIVANAAFPNGTSTAMQQLDNLPVKLTTHMMQSSTQPQNDACSGTAIGNFQGAIALVRRGTCTFAQKLNNVVAAGAKAVIFWNNQVGADWPIDVGSSVSVPYITINSTDGNSLSSYIKNASANNLSSVTVTNFRFFETGISSYSSYGPAPALRLTPDFSAPGGNVYTLSFWSDLSKPAPSTVVSGTSFATPYIAGCAALYLQAARSMGLHPTPMQVRDALAATAAPIQVVNSAGKRVNRYVSPIQAGAGRINLTAAISALTVPVALSPPTLLLPTGLATIHTSFNISNAHPSATLNYTLTHIPTSSISTDNAMNISYVTSDPTTGLPQYAYVPYVPSLNSDQLTVTFQNSSSSVMIGGSNKTATVTVGPNATVTVQVAFTAPSTLLQGNYLVAGYIVANPSYNASAPRAANMTHHNLTLPYLGYTSNFTSLPILKPGIPGGIALAPGTYLANDPYMVLVDDNGTLVPPYNTQFAAETQNGTQPLLPVYLNDLVAGNMPTLYLNIQHQPDSFNFSLVEADPGTGLAKLDGTSYYLGGMFGESTVRSADPFPIPLPAQFLDNETGYLLPIPDGIYVTRFTFQRVNAIADNVAGRDALVLEEWVSPAFNLSTPGFTVVDRR